jgi:hypothetical protein
LTKHPLATVAARYAAQVVALSNSTTTTETSFYPAIRTLLADLVENLGLRHEVRVGTSEDRVGGGRDLPDLAIYEGGGSFLSVAGEIKLPGSDLRALSRSTDRKDQVGRYLAKSGVVLLSNAHGFALLAVRGGSPRNPARPVKPDDREILDVVDLWTSADAMRSGKPISAKALEHLASLVERAVTEFSPIAEPSTLARILAMQARRAKADLPAKFDAVRSLVDDYGTALGISFEGEEGEEFFRSSLIQTAFYGLFAGWALWHREGGAHPFAWEQLDRYLKIPFLGKLFYEFKHPDRLKELHLARHLDRATETLGRVDRDSFFGRFHPPSVAGQNGESDSWSTSAITYFYEPFLEAFDPSLRKQLGVWYTPTEIVRYQVGRIDQLLREELGRPRGLADDAVVVLDPCCGTGAYLIETVRLIASRLREEGEASTVGARVLDAVCRRILGFEILTAPFVIAQLQLYLILAELDAAPGGDQRPAIFLTNALTGWSGPEPVKLHFPELQAEYDAARRVKRDAKIIVVLGNPPYNRFAGAPVREEETLADHYKGIVRNEQGKQIGQSRLFAEWGVRKHLLDDLYVRFVRLGEQRIGEVAEYGVVSFISNSSFLTGRSHPVMRESLLSNFHAVWIDNLNGDKYKTGKVIPAGFPGEGTSDQSVFTTEADARGIQVGVCIATYLKRGAASAPPGKTEIRYRDFWGRAAGKRSALVSSLVLSDWSKQARQRARELPEGPREYESIRPTRASRWMLAPRDVSAGFESWPALDELFPVSFQGVNPNRGLENSLIDTDQRALSERMRAYYEAASFSGAAVAAPELCEPRARYEPEAVWNELRRRGGFDSSRLLPYLVFPLDNRWLYYETSAKLLNERRPEYGDNLEGNEFLIAVPQPRRVSETRPLLATTLADLHLHDRGSVCFPAHVEAGASRAGTLFASAASSGRHANIAPAAQNVLRSAWGLSDGPADGAGHQLVRELFRIVLAIAHSPRYESDHADGIAQGWARVPLPRDPVLARDIARAGGAVGVLLDPLADATPVINESLGNTAKKLAAIQRVDGRAVKAGDLVVSVSYYGAAKGKFVEHEPGAAGLSHKRESESVGHLFINADVYFAHIPAAVWAYELGGYPVLKKWLGYRQASRRDGKPLTLAEATHFRSMVQRLAALLTLHPHLDELYVRAVADAFTAEELGVA